MYLILILATNRMSEWIGSRSTMALHVYSTLHLTGPRARGVPGPATLQGRPGTGCVYTEFRTSRLHAHQPRDNFGQWAMHRATLDNHDTRCRCVYPYSHRIAVRLTLRAAFLNLHRQYFAQAINEGLWTNHKYALSVAAVYHASLTLLWSLEAYYRQPPVST